MQADSLLLGKVLLFEFELGREIEQAKLLLLFGNDLVEKGQMITEENDGRRIVDFRILADVTLEENRRHGRDVLVAEAQIGASESGISGLDRRYPDFPLLVDHVPRKDFFCQRHCPCGAGALARVFDRWQEY